MDGDNGVISQLLQWIELMLEPCNPFDHLRSPAVKEQRLGRNTTVAGRSAYYQACCLAAARTSHGRRFSEFISITRRQVMNPDSSTEEDSDEDSEDSSSSDNIANQQTLEPPFIVCSMHLEMNYSNEDSEDSSSDNIANILVRSTGKLP